MRKGKKIGNVIHLFNAGIKEKPRLKRVKKSMSVQSSNRYARSSLLLSAIVVHIVGSGSKKWSARSLGIVFHTKKVIRGIKEYDVLENGSHNKLPSKLPWLIPLNILLTALKLVTASQTSHIFYLVENFCMAHLMRAGMSNIWVCIVCPGDKYVPLV